MTIGIDSRRAMLDAEGVFVVDSLYERGVTVMPFTSKAQQGYMFANHPRIAKRWAKHTPDMKSLPAVKAKKKREKVAARSPRGDVRALCSSALSLFGCHSVKKAASALGWLSGAQAKSTGGVKLVADVGVLGGNSLGKRGSDSNNGWVACSTVAGYDSAGRNTNAAIRNTVAGLSNTNAAIRNTAAGLSNTNAAIRNTNTGRLKVASQQGIIPPARILTGDKQQTTSVLKAFDTSQRPIPQDFMMIGATYPQQQGKAEILGSPIASGKLGNGPGVGMSGAGTQQNFGSAALPKVAGSFIDSAGVQNLLSSLFLPRSAIRAKLEADWRTKDAASATRSYAPANTQLTGDANRVQRSTVTRVAGKKPATLIGEPDDIRYRKFEKPPEPTQSPMVGGANTAQARGGRDMLKQAIELLRGGIADNKPTSKYDKKQIAMGKKVEMEHVNDTVRSTEISKDHLEEIPDYYTRLSKMEREAKQAGCAAIMGTKRKKAHKSSKAVSEYRKQAALLCTSAARLTGGDMTKEALTPTQVSLLSAAAGGGIGAGVGALAAGKDKRKRGALAGGLLGAGIGGTGGMLLAPDAPAAPDAAAAAPDAAAAAPDAAAAAPASPAPMEASNSQRTMMESLKRLGKQFAEPYSPYGELLRSLKIPEVADQPQQTGPDMAGVFRTEAQPSMSESLGRLGKQFAEPYADAIDALKGNNRTHNIRVQ